MGTIQNQRIPTTGKKANKLRGCWHRRGLFRGRVAQLPRADSARLGRVLLKAPKYKATTGNRAISYGKCKLKSSATGFQDGILEVSAQNK